MVSPPKGTVFLTNSPLSKDNEHQIKFNSEQEQQTYFNSLEGKQFSYNYVRHENTMVVPCDYYEAIKYNYVVYQNTYVNDKWFFCFIEKFEYVNVGTTKLYLKFDVWQTWQFDIDIQKSFIERSHVQNDEQNTLSDNPSTGNLIEYKSFQRNFSGGYFIFCNADVTQEDTSSSNGYDFKLGNYSIPAMVLFYNEQQAASMALDLQRIANKGYGDRITSAVYVPCCNLISTLVVDTVNGFPVCRGTNYPDELLKQTISFDFSDIDLGHEKCLTFPYAKIVVQDLATGQTIELEPNKFGSKVINFEVQATVSETPSYRIIPLGYKNLDKSYSDSLVVKCNTSLPVANSSYAKYLMNNQDFNALRMAGSTIGIAGSIMSGSAMGAITGFESITNVLLQEQQAQKQPNQLSNITDGALERLQFQNGVRVSLFVMDTDHRQMANDYWTLFGYPKRTLEYPVFYSTLDYQFMKTQSANINGNIPQDDLVEIQDMFNRGVTMWKADKFRQY